MNTLLQVLHVLAGLVVLAEALNKLERCDPLAAGINFRERLSEILKAIAWFLLGLGSGGAVIAPILLAMGVKADDLQAFVRLGKPTLGETCALLGFAVLVIRTRVKEG